TGVSLEAPCPQVELEPGEPVSAHLVLARLRQRHALCAAQHRAYASQQLAGTERLGEICVRSEFETHDAVGLVAHASQHDYRNGGTVAERAHDRHAILAG